jgi:DNA mismatch endonuclease (patch repair protein)
MRGNKKRDTKPELALRSALHAAGLRFRVDFPIAVPGRRPIRADIAFTRQRLAVFVDGCFWHRCPDHCSVPVSNRSYWMPKLQRNAERDVETTNALRDATWTVVRVWEHADAHRAVETVVTALSSGSPAARTMKASRNG